MTVTSLATPDTPTAEELNARQALGLDDGPDIEALYPQPTRRDRSRFQALLHATPNPAPSMTIDMFKVKRINTQIVDTVKSVITGNTVLLRHLGAEVLRNASAEELRATPSVFLQRILDTTQARDLTDRLLQKLKWYGARPGEQTPMSIRNKLICRAICLYHHEPSSGESQELAGFRWQDPAHWGKNYQTLRSEFEQHLVHTRRAFNSKDAILLAHVFQTRLSKDFAVRDIPPELAYKSSVVWVNFMHGVLLADEFGLDRLQQLSFQQLVDLPLARSIGASPEELEKIARLRVVPALEWAVCTGVIQPRTASNYDEEDIKQALTTLESQSESISKAVMTLELRPPDRLKMAKQAKDDALGLDTFESDGRKLVPPDEGSTRGFTNTPTLKVPGHAFLDVYADGQLDNGKKWAVTKSDGKTRNSQWIEIDEKRNLRWKGTNSRGRDVSIVFWGTGVLPDINAQFESDFTKYLSIIRPAYQTLIVNLLVSLPLADRRALVQGDVRILSLRQNITTDGQSSEVRARKGFLLQATHNDDITYYEVIPSAGLICRRSGLRYSIIGGVYTEFPLHASIPGQSFSFGQERTSLLLDWSAHLNGTPPKNQRCIASVDIVGDVPATLSLDSTAIGSEIPGSTSSRLNAVAHYIASQYLYVDEQQLHTVARGMTVFDTLRAESERRREMFLAILKGFVPFWGSIEDILSGDTRRILEGAAGLLLDLASFLSPIGKFISGSVRLVRLGTVTSHMAVKASLPSFSTLTRKLLTSSLKNLNPLDGIPTLLKTMGSGTRKGLQTAGRSGYQVFKKLAGHNDSYRLVQNLPQATDPGTWKLLTPGDRLATVNGVDDVLIRNTSPSDLNRFHLVDPATSLPYGPRLHGNRKNLTHGRSTFKSLPPTESHVLAILPEHAHVREILEVDGRTTLLVDHIPYRLDANQLRRADLIDEQAMFKALPCRIRRAPDTEVCKTIYVNLDPAPTPDIGSFDNNKGWAPWFGDCIYTPAIAERPLFLKNLKGLDQLMATLEFQKGIYGRIKARVPSGRRNRFDTFEAGAIDVPAMDGSKHYVFTRLGAGDFYVAERLPGQSPFEPLTLRNARTLPTDLAEELKTVYAGSLNANNMVRIHGTEAVERAMKTMDEIAIPIGGHVNPPDTLKLLKVDTSPGEAVLFDHSTRMIVSKFSIGAASWSRSRSAPESFRQRAADIFDTLFVKKTIAVELNSDLKINKAMEKLHKLLPPERQTHNARNIAYADIVTSDGKREVYVSVSGGQGLTGELPLFKPPFAPDEVIVNGTTYFNIDLGETITRTSLNVSDEGKILAIPRTITNIETYQPAMTRRPTSLDSEAKLVSALRAKYPESQMITSIDVATTMPPCTSCSVVIKEFGYDGGSDALQVLWN